MFSKNTFKFQHLSQPKQMQFERSTITLIHNSECFSHLPIYLIFQHSKFAPAGEGWFQGFPPDIGTSPSETMSHNFITEWTFPIGLCCYTRGLRVINFWHGDMKTHLIRPNLEVGLQDTCFFHCKTVWKPSQHSTAN